MTKKAAILLIVLPVMIYFVGILIFFIVAQIYVDLDFFLYVGSAAGTPFGILAVLLSFSIMTAGIFATLRLFRIKLETLTGPFSNTWPLAVKSFAITFLVLTVSLIFDVLIYGGLEPHIELTSWLTYLLPFLVAIFIQISAEELFFRGALPVALDRLLPSRLLINIIVSALFGLAHYEPEVYGEVGARLFVLDIAVMSFLLLDLTFRARSIGPALGWHFANNVLIFLFVSTDGDPLSYSLFQLNVTSEEVAASYETHAILILLYLVTYLLIRVSVLRR